MKNRDFRFFEIDKLPIVDDVFAKAINDTIGTNIYTCETQKNMLKDYLISKFGPKCAYCGAILTNVSSNQIDHFNPRDSNNVNNPKNLAFSCFMCNNTKRKAIFSNDFYPYSLSYSQKFKRNEYGCIVPASGLDSGAALLATQLHFSSISRTITYVYLLVDCLTGILETNKNDSDALFICQLYKFKKKIEQISLHLCLNE